MNFHKNYKLYKDYRDEEWLREEFFAFTKKIFGLSFKEWYNYGFWNNTYICYSLFDGDNLTSNVSLSKLDVVINGEEKKAIQLATVGTLDEYRGKGLSRYLIEMVLNDYKDDYDFFFLSANDTVVDFYPRFGFKRILEYKFTCNPGIISNDSIRDTNCQDRRLGSNSKYDNSKDIIQVVNKDYMRKLYIDSKDDMAIIKNLFKERTRLSNVFSIKDYSSIFMWYVVNFYRDSIWYLADEEIIIVYQIEDQTLDIYDIISKDSIKFSDIVKYMDLNGLENIRFHFTPDLIDIEVESEPIISDDPFFVLGDFPLGGKEFKVPQLAQT